MDKLQLTNEILALVDSSPLNDVDIEPIITKYTNSDMHVDEHFEIRGKIIDVLKELKEDKEINFIESLPSEMLVGGGGTIRMKGFIIRGTRYRQQRIEQEKQKINSTNNSSSIHLTNSPGAIVTNHSGLSNARIKPITETTNSSNPARLSKSSKLEIWYWIAGIILGLIALYEFVIKHFFIENN